MLTYYGVNFEPDLQVKAIMLVNTLYKQNATFKSQFRVSQKAAAKIFVPRLLDTLKQHRGSLITFMQNCVRYSDVVTYTDFGLDQAEISQMR